MSGRVWIALGILAVLVALFAWSICASAKRGDELYEEMRRREGWDE